MKENKKVRKKEKTRSRPKTDQENDQEKKRVFFLGHSLGRERVFFLDRYRFFFVFILIAFLVESVFSFFSSIAFLVESMFS